MRTRAVTRPALWTAYLAFGVVGMCMYLLPTPLKGSEALFNTLGLTSWIAVVVGIRRNKPGYALPWWLFAFGFLLYWMGDFYTYSYRAYILHSEVPFPSIGDAIYLTVYPAQMLGLLLLVRRRNPRRNRNTLIDAAILTLGLSVLSWILQIAPYIHEGSMGVLPKVVSVAYPLGDIILLAAAIRLVLDGGRRQPAFYLMGASIVSLLATDFIYGVMTLNGTFHHQLLLDLGWFSYQLLWGAAALHPSMAAMDEPVTDRDAKDREARLTPLRLSLLAGASLIAPVCIFVRELRRGDLDLMVTVSASVVLFGLVVMRMVDLVRQQERSAARERLLGRFGAALVTCATREEMQQSALNAIVPLLDGPGVGVLCLIQDDALAAVARNDDLHWPPRTLPEHVAATLLELAADGSPRCVPLEPAVLAAMDIEDGSSCGLVLPLALREGILGLLVLACPSEVSRQARDALEALANQLALALEGARLSGEIHARRSEARFASLVQHSSDLITVVGSDATITYQSPSSEHILGYQPAELLGTRFDRLVAEEDAGGLLRLLADGSAYARRDRPGDRVHAAPSGRRAAPVRDPAHEPAGGRARARHRPQRPRHQRAQDIRGAARPPGVPRPGHQPRQPRAVRGAGASRDRPRTPRGARAGRHVPRHRRLQDDQRQSRARRR